MVLAGTAVPTVGTAVRYRTRTAPFLWTGASDGHVVNYDILRLERRMHLCLTTRACLLPLLRTSAGLAGRACATRRLSSALMGEAEHDPLVQYIVLRRDLQETEGWPLGALVAQGSHAAVAAVAEHWDTPACRAYVAPDAIKRMTKAVLEVKGEPQLRGLAAKLEEGGAAHVLWVEQPENFPTCLATAPARKSTLAPFFKKCRLSSWHDVKATSGAQQAPEGT